MNRLSSTSLRTFSATAGWLKLGQPQPASNLVSDANSSVPQPTQRYWPSRSLFQYSPVNGRSVPFCRVTRYCSGASWAFHSASVFLTLSTIGFLLCCGDDFRHLSYAPDQRLLEYFCAGRIRGLIAGR